MARTSDPHAAALKAWQTRARASETTSSADSTDRIDQANAKLLHQQEVRDAIKTYVTTAEHVNRYLRKNVPGPERAMDAAETLVKALSKARLPESATLYRGVRKKGVETITGLRVGDIFEDKGVVSTSENSGVGVEFSDAGGSGYLIRIRARQGQRGLPIARESKYDRTAMIGIESEKETLLPPGTRFRVTKVGTEKVKIPMETAGEREVRIIDMDLLD